MTCLGEERLNTRNAEHRLFTAMVINSVHRLACDYLTCQHLCMVHALTNGHPSTAAYPQIWQDERQTLLKESQSYVRLNYLILGDGT